MSKKLEQHYRQLLIDHGDSAESAQYSNRQTQEMRYEILTQIADLNNASVLDFGCGTGHLLTYLTSRGINVHYSGVDVVSEFFEYVRAKAPGARAGFLSDFSNEKFDFVFVSGVFNNKRRDNRKFYQHTLRKLFDLCNKGLAFNMMSTYVDFQDNDLFYESPERAFRFVKQHLTPFVNLRHDYRVKSGVLPFEYAIYAYKI